MTIILYTSILAPILLLSTILLLTETLPIMVFTTIALLALTFMAMLFLMTQYLALIFLIVYVGAIAILLVFGLMVFDSQNSKIIKSSSWLNWIISSLFVTITIISVFSMNERISYQKPKSYMESPLYNFSRFDEFLEISKHLYTTYSIEFLIIGCLLVLGMIVVIALTVPPKNTKQQNLWF